MEFVEFGSGAKEEKLPPAVSKQGIHTCPNRRLGKQRRNRESQAPWKCGAALDSLTCNYLFIHGHYIWVSVYLCYVPSAFPNR